jgi:YVTN family beta-propeller protein
MGDIVNRKKALRIFSLFMALSMIAISFISAGQHVDAAGLKQDRLYAGADFENAIFVIDPAGQKVTSTISNITMLWPSYIAASTDGKKVYSSSKYGVYIINTTNNEAIKKLSQYTGYSDIAMNPKKNEYYVGAFNTSYKTYILVLNSNTDTELMKFASDPVRNLAVSPDGNRLYSATQVSLRANFTVHDLTTRGMVNTKNIPLPNDMAVKPDGSEVFVACDDSENFIQAIIVFNGTTGNEKYRITTGLNGPHGIAFSPDGKFLYITNYYSNTISVFNTATKTMVRTVVLGIDKPNKIAVTPDGKKAFVSHYNDIGSISVVNTTDYSVSQINNAGKKTEEMVICQVEVPLVIKPPIVSVIPGIIIPSATPAATEAVTATPAPVTTTSPTSAPTISPDITATPAATVSPAASPPPAATGEPREEKKICFNIFLGLPLIIGGLFIFENISRKWRNGNKK